MKKILTYGTFDLLHYGHINLLKKAKQQGDYLIVGLSTDAFNLEKKKQLLEAIRYVDLVIPETSWKQKVSDIAEFKIDTLVMGDDWQGAFDFLEVETPAKVLYLPRTPEVSTTQIKKELYYSE